MTNLSHLDQECSKLEESNHNMKIKYESDVASLQSKHENQVS